MFQSPLPLRRPTQIPRDLWVPLQLLLACQMLFAWATPLAHAENHSFPHRENYPGVAIIDTETLLQRLNQVTVIDVRSRFEFDTVHMKGAKHAPVSHRQFDQALKQITRGNRARPLVFYCNGHHCEKSYLAARRAKLIGFEKVWTYDLGINHWAAIHPHETTLLGKTPMDDKRWISLEAFKQKQLGRREFERACVGPGKVIFDVRDPIQRRGIGYLDGVSQKYPIDRLIRLLGTNGFQQRHKGEKFCFFDAVGRQVRWLQYYLEEHGYSNYVFLSDGVAN